MVFQKWQKLLLCSLSRWVEIFVVFGTLEFFFVTIYSPNNPRKNNGNTEKFPPWSYRQKIFICRKFPLVLSADISTWSYRRTLVLRVQIKKTLTKYYHLI